MAEVNWDEAPEGTTHLLYGVWRKIHGDDHKYWDRKLNVWVEYGIKNGQKLIRAHKEFIIERPQAPQVVIINGVEVDWGKAPEGTTHAMTDHTCIGNFGQWRMLDGDAVYYRRGYKWVKRVGIKPDHWMHVNRGFFIEKPGLVAAPPVAKKEQPIVKKPIGWWS